ncbi:MAG: M48 family metalloprotease [Phycisphaerales bacterium]|nr:M48 family metalloprotease [Phycisphaerales bacterium]
MTWDLAPATSTLTALGWAVIHFTWQGAVIAAVVAALLAAARDRSAPARYAIACAGLLGCALSFGMTWAILLPGSVAAPLDLAEIEGLIAALPAEEAALRPVDIVAWLWLLGVLLCSLRLAAQALAARRLKTSLVEPAERRWQRILDDLSNELGLRTSIRLLRSGLAETPMVVGWIAPVVLVPAAAFASLTPEQLKSLLAHELSHIRRGDHLINALQAIVETVLFYHPAVWWISRQIRIERENCCDDIAARAAGSGRILAEALARLESIRITPPQTALAANGGPLMNRIARLLALPAPSHTSTPRWPGVAALAAAAVLTVGGLAQATAMSGMLSEPPTQEEIDACLETAIVRLQEGIDAGQLSTDDALARLDALRAHVAARGRRVVVAAPPDASRRSDEPSRAAAAGMTARHLAVAKQHLQEAARAGQISEQEIGEHLKSLEMALAQSARLHAHAEEAAGALRRAEPTEPEEIAAVEEDLMPLLRLAEIHADRSTTDVSALTRKIAESLHTGDLSPAEAHEHFSALRQVETLPEQARDHIDMALRLRSEAAAEVAAADQAARELDAVARDVHAAVLAGQLTSEEAHAKLSEIQRAKADRARLAAELELVQVRRDQARAELELARKRDAHRGDVEVPMLADVPLLHRRLAGRADEAAALPREAAPEAIDPRAPAAAESRASSRRQLHERLMGLLEQLRDEVDSGAMTVEEARAVLDALKAELGGGDR